MDRLKSGCAVFALLIALVSPAVWPASGQTTGLDEVNAQRATVLITQLARAPSGDPLISCIGTGMLVTADGLILTNAHTARGSARCKTDSLLISLTARPGASPVPTYYAEVLAANVQTDLAVLQIARTLDGRAVNRGALSLPFVEIGSSEDLALDETLTVIGYPGPEDKPAAGTTNSAAVAIRRGTITNFIDEAQTGDRAWLKTNAVITARMSGGGAFNKTGKLVAIPAGERSGETRSACRLVQDTNGDGRIDTSDVCIPGGGFIDSLRPARLARGLVRAAQLGLSVGKTSGSVELPAPSGAPTFDRLIFSTGVSASGMPNSVVRSAPTGTKSLYLFFDYRNLSAQTIYELRTTVDGIPNATFSLSPAAWGGGQEGLWYIGAREQVWPNGQYVFTLLIDGQRAASATFTVGGGAQDSATFSDILFGISDPARSVVITGTVLPPNTTINAEFLYSSVPDKATWRQVWYFEGRPITQNPQPIEWKDGASGKKRVTAGVTGQDTLIAGRYRLELYLNEALAATSDFVMAGSASGGRVRVFDDPVFSAEQPTFGSVTEKDASGKSVTVQRVTNANATYPNTVQRLYAAFQWTNIATGTLWTWRLTVDGSPLFEQTQPWRGAPDQPYFWLQFDATEHFPDASFALELYVEGILTGTSTVRIGIGQLPVNTFLLSSGVQVQGRIIDAETRRGIAGVTFIVIKGTVITREFTWNREEIVQMSVSDADGQFQLSRLLPRNDTYNILIVGRGYLPVSTDGLQIDANTPSPFTLAIELNRD